MAQAQFKILVVDDEPDLEHLVRQRMRRDVRAGRYLFAFAHNGIEALEILNEDPDIDMVLTDINMPQMDRPHPARTNSQSSIQHPLCHRLGLWRHEKHPHGHEPGGV